jgi:hypothetical protein
MEALKPSNYNPLKCTHPVLPVNVVLMIKLALVGFLLQGDWSNLPEYFLPFISVFDALGNPYYFKITLQAVFLLGVLLVFTNLKIRTGAFLTGSVILMGILSSHLYYRNALAYTGLILFLASLPPNPTCKVPTFLRWQVRLLYWGAATNKLLEPDWRSDQFFENLLKGQWAQQIRSYFPPLLISRIMGWTTIATESALAIGFSHLALYRFAIWLGILFHGMITFVMNYDFGIFLIATAASYLVFVEWPEAVKVELAQGNVLHKKLHAVLSKTNWDQIFTVHWNTHITGLKVSHGQQSYQGWLAWRQLLLLNTLFYILLVLLMCLFFKLQCLRWFTLVALTLFNPSWDLQQF